MFFKWHCVDSVAAYTQYPPVTVGLISGFEVFYPTMIKYVFQMFLSFICNKTQ